MTDSHDGLERISPRATRSLHSRVLAVDEGLLDRKAGDSRVAARRREIHTLHASDAEPLQRMLNSMQPGSYVTPHRHLRDGAAEALVLLRGSVGFVAFLDDGTPDREGQVWLSPEGGALALDCRPGVFHTFFALEPDTVVYEVKAGPYDADGDKDFAPWAPPEDSPEAGPYLARLEDGFRRRFALPRRRR